MCSCDFIKGWFPEPGVFLCVFFFFAFRKLYRQKYFSGLSILNRDYSDYCSTKVHKFWNLWFCQCQCEGVFLKLIFCTIRTFSHSFIQVWMWILSQIGTEGQNRFHPSLQFCQGCFFLTSCTCMQEQPSWLWLSCGRHVYIWNVKTFFFSPFVSPPEPFAWRQKLQRGSPTHLTKPKKKVPIEIPCTRFLHTIGSQPCRSVVFTRLILHCNTCPTLNVSVLTHDVTRFNRPLYWPWRRVWCVRACMCVRVAQLLHSTLYFLLHCTTSLSCSSRFGAPAFGETFRCPQRST